MTIEIKEITAKRDLEIFIRFPYKLFHGNPLWVPPMLNDERNLLNPDKNPAFEFCKIRYWLAFKSGQVAGRVAGVINERYNQKTNQLQVRFGWLEFIDDEQVCHQLLKTVEDWAREINAVNIHGPMGFSTFDHYGVLVEGFDEVPTLASVYNPPYYVRHLESYGLKGDEDYVEFQITVPDTIPAKVDRVTDLTCKRYKLSLLKVKTKYELLAYGHEIFELLNLAYENLAYTSSLTKDQVDMYIKKYLPYVDLKYIHTAKNEKGQVIGFIVAMPSLSKAFQKAKGRMWPFGWFHVWRALKKPDILDLYLVGVLPEYRGKGVSAIFMGMLNKGCIKDGVKIVETNTIMQKNKNVNAHWKNYTSRRHKRKRIYLKEL